jgi:hypothetical protein
MRMQTFAKPNDDLDALVEPEVQPFAQMDEWPETDDMPSGDDLEYLDVDEDDDDRAGVL